MSTKPVNVKVVNSSQSDSSKLLKDDDIHINERDKFVFEESIFKESKIIFNLSVQIGLSILFEVGIGTISTIFLGHLPNAKQILSGTGMAYSFANMTAIGM